MNALDLLIIAVVFGLALIGFAQGFIVGAASLGGLALGGLVGTRLTEALLGGGDASTSSAWAPLIGLSAGLLITVIGAMAMQDLGAEVRARLQSDGSEVVDRTLGAVLLAIVGLLLAWLAAASTVGVPSLRQARPYILGSSIVRELNDVLPDAAPLLGAIASYDPFPQFDGGSIVAEAPDGRLPSDPEVRRAASSVVRIIGSACGYQVTGSGWVISAGFVVTNAHVVGGQRDTAVQIGGRGELRDADVVAFDAVNDIAILRVDHLRLQPLTVRGSTRQGTPSVVLGYPEAQGFVPTAARYSDERVVKAQDIYGNGSFERRITTFRGLVRHGNSGGPVVDGDGRVISTVFAATVGEKVRGGYGIPNDLVLGTLERAQQVPSDMVVQTGDCVA